MSVFVCVIWVQIGVSYGELYISLSSSVPSPPLSSCKAYLGGGGEVAILFALLPLSSSPIHPGLRPR